MVIQSAIEDKLRVAFSPEHQNVTNESHMHNVPPGSESHFKVILVSEAFAGKRQVQRHQQVYKVLAVELAGAVHALALHTYTPGEFADSGQAPDSPQCLGGGR